MNDDAVRDRRADDGAGHEHWLRETLDYWFVLYNPLYFFSAACVLSGIYTIAHGLQHADWRGGQLLLMAVTQLYEAALIGAVWFLFRVNGQRRPAVILAFLESFFLLDPTFRTEGMSTLGSVGGRITLLWVALVPLKVSALAYALDLRIGAGLPALAGVLGLGVAAMPDLPERLAWADPWPYLAAGWMGAALAAVLLLFPPKFEALDDLDEWGRTVLRRSRRAIGWIWHGIFYHHLWSHVVMMGVRVETYWMLQIAAFLLLVPLAVRNEAWGMFTASFAVLLAAAQPPAVAPVALVAALTLIVQALRTEQSRLFVAATLLGYVAWWTSGWQSGPWPTLPAATSPAHFTLVAVLLAEGWYLRVPLAYALSGFGFLLSLRHVRLPDPVVLGTMLVGLGFAALAGGVTVSWLLGERRAVTGSPPERPAA